MDETKVHVLDGDGKRMWRGKCHSHPDDIEAVLRQRAPQAERIGLETGPLTTWLWTELTGRGLPMVCLDARHAKRALDMRPNKTTPTMPKASPTSSAPAGTARCASRARKQCSKALAGARGQLTTMVTDLSNQIRGVMKTFGLVVPKGSGGVFERNVRALLDGAEAIAAVVTPLLDVWRLARQRAAALERRLLSAARESAECRLLMTMPSIGAVTAASFVAAIERPESFTRSRNVGAWLGLTPRVRADSALRRWGLALKKRLGFKRAVVAVARKMAVALHAMWRSGAAFRSDTPSRMTVAAVS